MSRPNIDPRILKFKPNRAKIIETIRKIITNTRNVYFSEHAMERMDERGLTSLDIIRALRVGDIVGEITPGKKPGEWQCKVVERRKKARDIGVATIIVSESRLFIKTAEWED